MERGQMAQVQTPTEQTYTFHKASAETASGINLKRTKDGVVIASLKPKGAAADCGLAAGDAVLSINGMRVTSPDQGSTLLKSVEAEVTVCITRLVAEPAPVRVPVEQTYTFHKATAETMCGITQKRDGKDTVITSLNAGGAAASCGLAVGDAMISINGMRVTSPEQAATLLKSVEGEVTVCITRLVL